MSTDELMQHAANFAGPRGRRRLVALIAAAKVSARPGELAGEEAVMAAFRVHAAKPPIAARRSAKATLARLLTIKVGALCAAVLGVGGVALAASTGSLPGPLADLGLGHRPASAGQAAAPGQPAADPARSAHINPAPPAVIARCKDYLGWDQERRRRAIGHPDVHELESNAHSQDPNAVAHYCGQVQVSPSVPVRPSPSTPLHHPHSPGSPPPVDPSPPGDGSPTPTDQPSQGALEVTSPEAPSDGGP
jgi:hypothetical protein